MLVNVKIDLWWVVSVVYFVLVQVTVYIIKRMWGFPTIILLE